MKIILKRIFTLLVINCAGISLCKSQNPVTPPGSYPVDVKVNYVRTWEVFAPEANPNTVMTRPVKDVKMTTQYFDGLGRLLQTVLKQGSLETGGTATDIVMPVVYDEFGREVYKYLPFTANNTGGNSSITDGLFKMNPFQQQATFMTAQYGGQGETFFYSKTNFEASPFNRPENAMSPGNSWVGSQRGVELKNWINTATDAVRIWDVSENTGTFGSYSSTTIYPAGELFKSVIIDEHGKQIIEFKDKEGKIVLKKVQLTATADAGTGSGYLGWLCTFYIYDNLNNLRCVIQPQAVKQMSDIGNWDLSPYYYEQCFRYEFDERNRIVMKKVPGAGEVWMVYDVRDRLILTQDANLRAQDKWMYTLYDVLNRPEVTGLWTNSNDRLFHKSQASTSSTYPNLSGQTIEELTKTFYDNYDWRSSHGNPLSATYDASFDTYFQLSSNVNWPYAQVNIQTEQLKGMATGSRIKVLGTSTYLYTVSFYDEKGRVIQVQSTNITGGVDIATTQYTWAGQPLVMVQRQEKAGGTPQTSIVVTQMTYDDLGRVTKTEKKVSNTLVNSGSMPAYKTIAQNEYDKLGQLTNKILSPTGGAGGGPLETLAYDYNIRGWMLGMNRNYAKDASSTNYFGFDLGYDKANNGIIGGHIYTNPQYNGNIEGMVWKSKGDGEKRKYDFSYDAANRLLKADFTQYTGSVFGQSAGVNFNVKMGDGINVNSAYDANGNILQMQQWGLKIIGSSQIDNLDYLYQTNSSKLARVTDANNDPTTKLGDFKDGANTGTDDYSYDINGNLVLDNNKAISSITYNYLNLPSVITVTGKGTISYIYDAAGTKLKKEVNETGQPLKTTLYLEGSVLENDVLQFLGHEEGRIRFKPASGSIPASLQYDYMLKDHLGNVRMVLAEEQQQDKYPVASLEDAKLSIEQQYYIIDATKIELATNVTGLPTYTNDNGIGNNPSDPTFEAANSQKLYKLNSSVNKTGLGITLKIMAGDKIDIFGKSYYFQNNTGGSAANTTIPILDLLSGLMGTPGGATAGSHTTATELSGITGVTTPINSNFLNTPGRDNSTYPQRPKAFINYLFLDEQFRFVDGGFSPVNSTSGLKNHFSELQNRVAQKNGYIYIYVSNESPVNVFFDNLQVVHTRGSILEETHYYPFGLVQAGISSKALSFGDPKNKEQTFQEQRFDDDFGINYIQFKYRSHDPQIGRFIQIDPLSHDYRYNSTYAFSENRVTDGRELEGLEYVSIHHYANGTNGIKSHYKSTDAEINKIHGTTSGIYNSASYGPQGKGVVHYYYDGQGALIPNATKWDQRQTGGNSDFAYHGLYSGPGSITKDGGANSTNYDFSFQPIDWSDAIAKRHDMDYAAATATGEKYAGFLEDVRTLQADKDMVQRIDDYGDLFRKVKGVETPYRTSWSGEMELSMKGQSVVITALATYKQWKIDNNYGNKDTYDKLRDDFIKENKAVAFIIDKIVNR